MTDSPKLGCTVTANTIVCRKEAGWGCPGAGGGPHYFIFLEPDFDERCCMDCGMPESEVGRD